MATTYVKINGSCISSEDKAFSRIIYRSALAEVEASASTLGVFDPTFTATTTRTLINLGSYGSTIVALAIENLDKTNRAKIEHNSGAGDSAHWLDAGGWMLLPTVTVAEAEFALTAENANVELQFVFVTYATTL